MERQAIEVLKRNVVSVVDKRIPLPKVHSTMTSQRPILDMEDTA